MDITEALREVELRAPFEGLTFRTGPGWLQVREEALGPALAGGRKWRVSEFASKSEVIQTALAAVIAWQEHEVREAFRYRGQAIFGPHYNVDALAVLASGADAHDVRTPPTTKETS